MKSDRKIIVKIIEITSHPPHLDFNEKNVRSLKGTLLIDGTISLVYEHPERGLNVYHFNNLAQVLDNFPGLSSLSIIG